MPLNPESIVTLKSLLEETPAWSSKDPPPRYLRHAHDLWLSYIASAGVDPTAEELEAAIGQAVLESQGWKHIDVQRFCPQCGSSKMRPSWNQLADDSPDMSACGTCRSRHPSEHLPTAPPPYPLPVFAWFDTGDGLQGPLAALLLGLPEGPTALALVEILDADHLAAYGTAGEPYAVTADLLPERGEVGRDRYCWSPYRIHQRLRRIRGALRFQK